MNLPISRPADASTHLLTMATYLVEHPRWPMPVRGRRYGPLPSCDRLTQWSADVLRERALLAIEDPTGENDAVAPLDAVRARQILLHLAATPRRPQLRRPDTGRLDDRELLRRLGADLTRGRGVTRCPAHEDRHPSLSWRLEADKALLHCFSGCTFDQIVAVLS